MKRFFLLVLAVISILFPLSSPASSSNPPHSNARLEDLEGKPYPLDQLVQFFQVGVNSIPYFLLRYLDTGDVLLLQQIREANDRSGAYVTGMEKRIRNDFQKGVFAKVLTSYHKFKDNVGRNLKAINEFRRVRRAFEFRSDQLIDWISTSLEASFQGSAANQGHEVLRAFRELQLAVVRAVTLSRYQACAALDQTRRNKAKEAWENTSRQAALLLGSAGTLTEKETSLRLIAAVDSCKALAEEMFLQADELSHAWEQTQSVVESLDSLICPLYTGQTKKEGSK
ncbi:MAG: hypothetical protein HY912_11310 [Desulfomonile tiedjei]|uniref:Uncharacterized protein n=1 Tax=Desulfomonile tiedjei TaxID=2358 RepID=A0A9D6V0Z7_9BACT|nr:hypothetical protein [Desulfomonile tiedjei]